MEQKVVALYLLSGPQTNALGLYRLSPGAAAEDLKMKPAAFQGHLLTVCAVMGWTFDAESRVLWIPTWPVENPPENPNVAIHWRSHFDEVPNCPTKSEALNQIRLSLSSRAPSFMQAFSEAFTEPFSKALSKGVPNPIGIQDQDQESGTVTGTEVIGPPPPASVARVARSRTGGDDPGFQTFWAAYPRKVARPSAVKVWRSLKVDEPLLRRMLTALDWQRHQPIWVKDRGQFVPHPATWLSNRRWDDEPFNAPDPTDAVWAAIEAKTARRTS